MRFVVRLITLWTLIISVGCQANPITPESIASPISPPSQGEITQVPTSIPTPADARLQSLLEKAKEDLAQRLTIATTQINFIEATEMEWSDSSLGCPQPGMEYLQVITPGYRILLDANGTQYEYHSNRDAYFVLCDNTNPPILPKP